MPLIERTNDKLCPVVSRFTFTRTAGPSTGLKDVAVYYTIASGQTTPATTGVFGLGIGGYMTPAPPRTFGFDWKPLARSTPAPLVLGTTSEYVLDIQGLFYHGRNIQEIEEMLYKMPTTIGPYQGTLKWHKQDGLTLYKSFTNCYYHGMSHNYDGAKNFVEYSIQFTTISEQS